MEKHITIHISLPKFKFLRLLIAYTATVLLHFNMKLWIGLINPRSFDNYYFKIDQLFPSLTSWADYLYLKLGLHFIDQTHNTYHELFIVLFVLAFTSTIFLNNNDLIFQMVTADILVFVFGSLFYYVAPALGPFIYQPGLNLKTTETQQLMINYGVEFLKNRGNQFNPSGFCAGLAAMPSLHIAHSLVFAYFSYSSCKKVFVPLLIIFFILTIESIALKWHYLIDIPAGCLVTFLSVGIAKRHGHKSFPISFKQ